MAAGFADEPEPLKNLRFEVEVTLAEKRKPLDLFDEQYRSQLRELEEQMQMAGELKKLLAVREELKKFGSGNAEGFRELGRLQEIYRTERQKIGERCLEAERLVITDYRKKLTELQKTFTKEGKIEDALAVSAEIERQVLGSPSSVSLIQNATGRKPGEEFINGIALKLCWIPQGSFLMGSPSDEPGRDPQLETQVQVEISQGFWMGKYEVTQEEYETVMGVNPSQFADSGKNNPVETVNWSDATTFCRQLNERERSHGSLPDGWHYTLPTEAQWEYACRAETKTAFNNGKGITSTEGECRSLDAVGWYRSNCDGTKTVGRKRANQWGLYDMHGNVREWCLDWFEETRAVGSTLVDPTGPETGSQRVDRGGYWNWTPHACRSAFRKGMSPTFRGSQVGFRIVLVQKGDSE
ncbi:MAG: SUMF1/EgtB/PvdO family nonheme iron enzyme [Verrucomicrobiae bacterium]|nr:SUMF1/EgtB/PvdO family nonheme iron enzyme [Verrucomicrobiae bacterium]